MLGTIVNALAIVAGGLVGLVFRGGIPEKYAKTVMHAIGLAVVLIGLKGALGSDALLVVIICLAAGSVVGEFLKIEDRLDGIGKRIGSLVSKKGEGISVGFVTATLLFCVGAMAIVGSLESGLSGNHQTLFAKSVLDGVTSVVFASTLGAGVLFSAVSVFLYQGAITLAASYLERFLVPEVVSQMSSVGGLLIVAIGINLLEIKRIKIGNMLPAIFLPLVYYMIKQIPSFFR